MNMKLVYHSKVHVWNLFWKLISKPTVIFLLITEKIKGLLKKKTSKKRSRDRLGRQSTWQSNLSRPSITWSAICTSLSIIAHSLSRDVNRFFLWNSWPEVLTYNWSKNKRHVLSFLITFIHFSQDHLLRVCVCSVNVRVISMRKSRLTCGILLSLHQRSLASLLLTNSFSFFFTDWWWRWW